MIKRIIYFVIGVSTFTSCSTSKEISFLCDDEQIEMYINDEYAGKGLVKVTVSGNTENVKVSCRENGMEIYSRTFYVKNKDKEQLYELSIPKDYRYSSGSVIIKSK